MPGRNSNDISVLQTWSTSLSSNPASSYSFAAIRELYTTALLQPVSMSSWFFYVEQNYQITAINSFSGLWLPSLSRCSRDPARPSTDIKSVTHFTWSVLGKPLRTCDKVTWLSSYYPVRVIHPSSIHPSLHLHLPYSSFRSIHPPSDWSIWMPNYSTVRKAISYCQYATLACRNVGLKYFTPVCNSRILSYLQSGVPPPPRYVSRY